MKNKLVLLLSFLILSTFSYAQPIAEEENVDKGEFIFGIIGGGLFSSSDYNLMKNDNLNSSKLPLLFQGNNGSYTQVQSYIQDNRRQRFGANLGLNARYGIFSFLEIFANVNSSYISEFNPVVNRSNTTSKVALDNANAGLLLSLYNKSDFNFILGFNSDIISNSFLNGTSIFQYGKGHTFFATLVAKTTDFSFVLQPFYRMNLEQSLNNSSLKIADLVGFNTSMYYYQESAKSTIS